MRSARRLAVVPFCALDPAVLQRLASGIEERFLHECVVVAGDVDADDRAASDAADAWSLDAALEASARGADPGELRLGVTTRELTDSAGASLSDGGARVGRGIAVVSLARLRPERYGERPDLGLTTARLLAAAVHHVGSALGRTTCPDPRCVRSIAYSVYELDNRRTHDCERCAEAA